MIKTPKKIHKNFFRGHPNTRSHFHLALGTSNRLRLLYHGRHEFRASSSHVVVVGLHACRVTDRVLNPDRNRSGYRGYRSNQPGSVPAGFKPAQIQILNLNLKNKKFLKIFQVATNLMVSKFFKYSFI